MIMIGSGFHQKVGASLLFYAMQVVVTYAHEIVHITLANYIHGYAESTYEYIGPDDEADLYVHTNRPVRRC